MMFRHSFTFPKLSIYNAISVLRRAASSVSTSSRNSGISPYHIVILYGDIIWRSFNI
jgi:hypothetical protein